MDLTAVVTPILQVKFLIPPCQTFRALQGQRVALLAMEVTLAAKALQIIKICPLPEICSNNNFRTKMEKMQKRAKMG